MDENLRFYIFYLFVFVLIIFAILIIIDIFNINLNTKPQNKKLIEVVTIEGLNTLSEEDIVNNKQNIINESKIPLGTNPAIDFCNSNVESNDMQEKCGKLTNTNCNKTNCCVWLNNEKCVPGNQNGPTFKTDKSGNKIHINNYYYNNKCYGKC